ncbi:MAG: DUF6580 family putative transport protein [Pirellulales bacterium]
MKKSAAQEVFVFALLVACGVAGRFAFLETPNFTPTGAVALFAGFYFSRALVAALAPLAVLILSNLWLPTYNNAGEMAAVYGAFLLAAGLGWMLRSRVSPLRVGACVLLPSVAFFVATNFAVWAFNDWYAHTWAGLAECYLNAAPFYRYMLAADLLFSGLFFGVYALVGALPQRGRLAEVRVPREPQR